MRRPPARRRPGDWSRRPTGTSRRRPRRWPGWAAPSTRACSPAGCPTSSRGGPGCSPCPPPTSSSAAAPCTRPCCGPAGTGRDIGRSSIDVLSQADAEDAFAELGLPADGVHVREEVSSAAVDRLVPRAAVAAGRDHRRLHLPAVGGPAAGRGPGAGLPAAADRQRDPVGAAHRHAAGRLPAAGERAAGRGDRGGADAAGHGPARRAPAGPRGAAADRAPVPGPGGPADPRHGQPAERARLPGRRHPRLAGPGRRRPGRPAVRGARPQRAGHRHRGRGRRRAGPSWRPRPAPGASLGRPAAAARLPGRRGSGRASPWCPARGPARRQPGRGRGLDTLVRLSEKLSERRAPPRSWTPRRPGGCCR